MDRPASLARHPARRSSGLPHAFGVYAMWGLLPLYFALLHAVAPTQIVAARTLFSLPLCLALAAVSGQLGEVRLALRDRARLVPLCASAALIGANWLVYVGAVAHGHVLAASLGYYINPLINVLLGTLFLGERLGRWRWLAVGLAGIGVALLAWGARDMLWISLALAITFALYGLVRKLVATPALAGLTVETLLLGPIGLAWLIWERGARGSIVLGRDWHADLLLASSGLVTVIPMLLFAQAARRLDLSTLGFIQYLTPTILFAISLLVFHEPLRTVQLASFILIWAGIAIYTADVVALHRRDRVGERPMPLPVDPPIR
jgi:chloramphenicol-sensitive protein RarD